MRVAVDEASEEGEPEDFEVEGQAPVADVEEVVLEALAQARVASVAVDLGPAGHAGLDMLAEHVAPPVFAELGDEFGAFWAGADEAHVA